MSRKKMATSAEKLCTGQAAPFRRFCDAVMSMRFEEEPKYCALTALFEPLVCGALSRPIVIDANTLRVRKRLCSNTVASDCIGNAEAGIQLSRVLRSTVTVLKAPSDLRGLAPSLALQSAPCGHWYKPCVRGRLKKLTRWPCCRWA